MILRFPLQPVYRDISFVMDHLIAGLARLMYISQLLNSKEQVVAFSSIAKTEINNVNYETKSLEYSLYNRFKHGYCQLISSLSFSRVFS